MHGRNKDSKSNAVKNDAVVPVQIVGNVVGSKNRESILELAEIFSDRSEKNQQRRDLN
jgi:hypothetical protein